MKNHQNWKIDQTENWTKSQIGLKSPKLKLGQKIRTKIEKSTILKNRPYCELDKKLKIGQNKQLNGKIEKSTKLKIGQN